MKIPALSVQRLSVQAVQPEEGNFEHKAKKDFGQQNEGSFEQGGEGTVLEEPDCPVELEGEEGEVATLGLFLDDL